MGTERRSTKRRSVTCPFTHPLRTRKRWRFPGGCPLACKFPCLWIPESHAKQRPLLRFRAVDISSCSPPLFVGVFERTLRVATFSPERSGKERPGVRAPTRPLHTRRWSRTWDCPSSRRVPSLLGWLWRQMPMPSLPAFRISCCSPPFILDDHLLS